MRIKSKELIRGGNRFLVKGAALLDDSTLWDKGRENPNMSYIEERDYAFTALGEINTVRLALKMDYFIDGNGKIKEEGFNFVDKQLAFAEKYNLLILLDMHVLPGGAIQDYTQTEENRKFWNDRELQNIFIKGWQAIASRYCDNQTILGYELMNEAVVKGSLYWNFMKDTARAIRKADPDHLIFVQSPLDWQLQKIDDDKVVYVYHFYEPLYFTHQNACWVSVYNTETQIKYPGFAKNYKREEINFDKSEFQKTFSVFKGLKNQFNAPLIIGEFAVIAFADEKSIANWIKDVIDLVYENDLDGYVYWRQISKSIKDPSRKGNCDIAIVNNGDYFSKAQFFGIRPQFARENPNFDGQRFYFVSCREK